MQQIISNFESLSEDDLSKYAGEWVAILDGKIIINSKSFKEIYEFVENKYKGKKLLIGKLPDALPTVLSLD